MLAASAIILTYTLAIVLIVLPKVEKSTQSLEEKNGKEVLNKVSLLTRSMQKSLDNFQKNALQYHKTELKNLTDAFWSIVQTKYEQSRQENIGSVLEARGEEFKQNLLLYYNSNKDSMSTAELKQAIINYVNIYRYNQGSGYFFIHDQTRVVVHPIYPEYKGRDFAHIKDRNNVYFVQEFYNLCRRDGHGVVHYQWKHAKTKLIEDKVAYVFKFEPFDWIIGTSCSVKELQDMLKNEVIYLARKIRYDQENYFFITGYDAAIIAHPYLKKGTDFSTRKDSHGKLIVPPMIKVARNNGEGFTRYWWKKAEDRPEPFEKLTFSKDFPEWKMVISTGSYIDDIQQEIDKQKVKLIGQLRTIMQKTTIGKSGYLYILDSRGNIIIHPSKNMEGRNARNLINPTTGHDIFTDVSLAARTRKPMLYKWDRPDDQGNFIYDKISWVEYIPRLQWYIASSAYTSELQATSIQLKKGLLLLGLTILLLSFLASFIFFRRLLQPISTLSGLACQVTKGDYLVRAQVKSDDEIGVLAHEFNTMVDTIAENIRNLDRKVVEKTKKIEEQKTLFATLFYESSDGILLLRNGRFVDCNRAAYQMLLYSNKQELIALHPSEISPTLQPDGRESQIKADEMIQKCLDTGSNRFEWLHLCKDGSKTFVEVVLTRVVIQDDLFIHVVWRDINEKKAAEKHLRKTVTEFGAVMDAIDYGILFMDDQLQARMVNQAFRDMWNVPDDFISQNPSMRQLMELNRYNNIYPVEDDAFDLYLDAREAEVLRGGIAPTQMKRKDGIILQYQCVDLPDGWRMLTYFDITELKNTRDQLVRAQKMEAIGMMAGGVAHDLNNILSGIVSYPDLILLQLPRTSKLRKPIEAIRESGERAAMVVADLLTVARGVASIRELHDLNTLTNQQLHSPECDKLKSLHPGVSITEHLMAAQSTISCSPVHIKKAIMNLLANAIESVAVKGEVHITTSNLQIADNDSKQYDLRPGHYVVLTVQDNGPGIDDDDISHIFEPFYSKKVMGRSGTGLGLSVVWNTVEDHDGRITVSSSKRGASFTLYFPVSCEPIVHHENKPQEKIDTAGGEHVLVVDDEPQLRDIAEKILTCLGYRVTTVSSGEEALSFIRQTPVDLLIIDMLMEPGLNGHQTYRKILAVRPQQKAIVASGFSESDDVKATLKLGAHGFIKKPYSMHQIAQVVKEALNS